MPYSSPYLESADPALTGLQSGSFSIAFWFQSSRSGAPYEPVTIFEAPAWFIVMEDDGTIVFSTANTAAHTSSNVSSTPISATGGWNFVLAVYDSVAASIRLYVNGSDSGPAASVTPDATNPEVPNFQIGTPSYSSDSGEFFNIDEVTAWARAVTAQEAATLWGGGLGLPYPFLGGAPTLLFQALLINTPSTPMVCAFGANLYSATRTTTTNPDGTQTFNASLDQLFTGQTVTEGFQWSATNFYDKVLLAQHENKAQYWQPPLPAQCLPLPGLPSADAVWDGVTTFTNHVVLWKDDRLKWSDVNDFSAWIPVGTTAVTAVLNTAAAFTQPQPGTNITLAVINPATPLVSLSLSGNLNFPDTNVGSTSTEIMTLANTGTAPVIVTGINLPSGFTATYTGTIAVGSSVPVLITFSPLANGTYFGSAWVSSNATVSAGALSIQGKGVGTTKVIELSGVLDFGDVFAGKSVVSDLVIKNTGTATLTVSGITLPATPVGLTGGFSGSFSGTIAAGATHLVPITFAPGTAGSYSGTLTVTCDSTSGDTTIAVLGGSEDHLLPLSIFLTDNGSCQFGSVPSGTTASGTLKIYNAGSGSLVVTSLTLPVGFTTTYTGSTIAAGAFASATITFAPTDALSYAGPVFVNATGAVVGNLSLSVSGLGTHTGKYISLSGTLDFGQVTIGSYAQETLNIANLGATVMSITSLTLPAGFTGTYAGPVQPNTADKDNSVNVLIEFNPTIVSTISDTITVNSDMTGGTDTIAVTGSGIAVPAPAALVAGQFLTLETTNGASTYYNNYEVVSMSSATLVMKLMDTTGNAPFGTSVPAGSQILTVDANEAGETRVVGDSMNGPIWRIYPQGDYAIILKERSIQTIQNVGLGSGTFYIHPEVSGEGLISRNASANLADGRIIFLGHKELYAYAGGPQLTPVCQQLTRQLYSELDRTRLYQVIAHNNETRNELWVQYPKIGGGFRVLVWNYLEDSASLDDYDPSVLFSAFGIADWSADPVWSQIPLTTTWDNFDGNIAWEDYVGASQDHVTVMGSVDGNLRLWGKTYDRDGAGYLAISETMDFDLGDPDSFKYVDVVVLGLQVLNPDPTATTSTINVQVGTRAAYGGGDDSIVWSDPHNGVVLVNGSAPAPVKINPGGSGRYLRLRFSSFQPGVQWRIASFEIHTRPGGTY